MGVVPKPGDRSSCMAHSLVVAPGLGVYILSTQAAFFKAASSSPTISPSMREAVAEWSLAATGGERELQNGVANHLDSAIPFCNA